MIYLTVAVVWFVLSLGSALLLGAAIKLADRHQAHPELAHLPFKDAA